MIKEKLKKIIPFRLRNTIGVLFGRGVKEREYYKHYELPDKSTTAYSHIQIANMILPNLRSGWLVLELGCGCGYFAHRASELGCRVTALDYSKQALRYARKEDPGIKGNRVNYILYDIQKPLPFSDNFFDAIVMMEVLEHTRNAREVLLEAYRVLKRSRKIFISVPHDDIPVGYHLTAMNENSIKSIFRGLKYTVKRPFLPWGTTYYIEVTKDENFNCQ